MDMRTQTNPMWRPLIAAAALPLLLSVPGSTSGAEPTGPSVEAFIDQILNTPVRIPHLVVPPQSLSHVTEAEVRDALDLTAGDVVSIDFGASDHAGFDVFETAATLFPVEGPSYFVMSTGATASALQPNDSDSTSTELEGLNTTEGEDLVQIVLELQPPPNASCLAFDFAFYSEEFPEFVGSEYNDAFIAEIGQSTFQIIDNQVIAPNNFAFDTEGNVISINTVFGVTPEAAAGTTYDGGTPLLTAVTPLEDPDDPVTITLSIMDLGDSIYDSTAFIDNFRWFFAVNCVPGADADSDGDALLDQWETDGIDYDGDGEVDLDLPAMGADPDHKDIFIEIDYMVLGGVGGHTHKPTAAALQTLIDAFNAAPVDNPDGTTGIHIHIDAGSDTIMDPVTNATWGSQSESDALTHDNALGTFFANGNYNWSEFDTIKGAGVPGNFDVRRADVFHYCIFAHNLSATSISGISRGIPASDLIVSLGSWTSSTGTTNEQAGTLMHELGHNLGLFHGGDDPFGNYEPNYLSIMSYAFQMAGLRISGADGNYDYSRFALPTVDENDLDETVGLSGVPAAAGYGTRFFDANGVARIVNNVNVAIDWNWDGDGGADTSVAVDVNGTALGRGVGYCLLSGDPCFNNAHCSGGAGDTCQMLTVLAASDNWAEIVFDGGAVGHLGEQVILPMETEANEITEEEADQIPTDFSVGIAGPGEVTLEACEPATYDYTISNTGDSADIYEITVSDVQGWADTSVLPPVLPLAAGSSVSYEIPVLIPQDTPDGTVDLLVITVTSLTNALVQDSNETETTAMSEDSDGDGFTDFCDECPDSDLSPTVVINGCDSGVPNQLFDSGCTMIDVIMQCEEGAGNHGGFVSCVAHLLNEWKWAGIISGDDKELIQSCAAQSDIPALSAIRPGAGEIQEGQSESPDQ
jgi:hypothetical protein